MAPRTSNRLQNQPHQKPSNAAQDTPAQADKSVKRKTSTAQRSTKDAGVSKKAKTKATTNKVEASDMQNLGKLSSLSSEILIMIVDNITDKLTISALMRTSKRLYTLMAPRLYNRVAVGAMYHAHIAKLIRTLEPHLTIAQKKQLKKEGKYRGQQEHYPAGLDEKQVPVCAGYVRQLIIGFSQPGEKHNYIVNRYFEEALKNLDNLQIVETSAVNKSICESIASLAGLEALNIHANQARPRDVAHLAFVKNLKHLSLEFGHDIVATGQRIIRNSMSTIQSLEMITYSGHCHYFQDWEKNLQSSRDNGASRLDKEPDFPALRSVRIEGVMVDEEFTKVFDTAIEFSNLRELACFYLRDSQTLLWPFLTDLVTSYGRSNITLRLQTLSIDMDDSQYQYDPSRQQADFAAKCSFIASFDTLTTLKLPDYGQHPENEDISYSRLSDTLIQAVLKHQNLRVLQISYGGITGGMKIPWLGAKNVRDIIDGLPRLREFEFAPDEPQMDEISQALCRGENLESLTCFPHASWIGYPRPDPLGVNILSSILSTFMSNVDAEADGREFVWERHYKLNRLDLSHTKWDIASKFGKAKKGHGPPKKFQVDVKSDTREVWYQSIPKIPDPGLGYDPRLPWMTKVAKEMDWGSSFKTS